MLYGQDEDIDQCCMDRMRTLISVVWTGRWQCAGLDMGMMGIMNRDRELVRIRGNGHVQYWDRMRVVIMEVGQKEDNDQGNDYGCRNG